MKYEAMRTETEATGQEEQFARAGVVLAQAIEARAFPGCAFGVLAGGKVVLQGALGRFTYDSGSPAVRPETVFDIASITKVVATTAAVMLLTQRGKLDLETRVGELLPQFVAGRGASDPARYVTLRHLLAHNSGLPGYVEFFRTAKDAGELMHALMMLPLEAEPGARAAYSDPGFLLLGIALERFLAEPLDAWVQREILEPLGMSATEFNPALDQRSSIPPSEEDTWFRHRRIQGAVQDENASLMGGVAGHAGLFSSVPDLMKFSAEILGAAGQRGAAQLFSQPTIHRFAGRQGPAGSSRALGWDTPSPESSAGHHFSARTIGHLGFSGCSLWLDLEAEVAVALLTNRTWPDRKNQLIRKVRPAFHDAIRESL